MRKRRRGQLPRGGRAGARPSPSACAPPGARSASPGWRCPNYFRRPYGPGWALVGDAGYNKDFITAQGISDAFRDAELCAAALDESFSGARSFEEAMGEYQSTRDRQVLPMYEFTAELATLQPPPPELERVLAAAQGNQEAMDGFARTAAGVISPADYFSEGNVARILGMAPPAGAARGRRTRRLTTPSRRAAAERCSALREF